MFRLFVMNGPSKGKSFEFDRNIVYLGRLSDNDIQIKEKTISRKHLRITKKGDKYVIRDFHPLIFFYLLSFLLLGACIPLAIRLFYILAITGDVPDINAMALMFAGISGLQTLFFGMWFDMEYNRDLR